MKKSILISSFIFSLLSICFNTSLVAGGWASNAPTLSTTNSGLSSTAVVCYTPTWPTTSNITETSATFSWEYGSGAQSFTVQTRFPNGTWANIPGGPVYNTFVILGGLQPNTTYEWRVKATCYGGESSNWTNPVTFTTLGSSCYAPNYLSTTNISTTTATFNWNSASGAVSYSIQWRLAGGTWQNLGGGPWTNTWVNVGGFNPGTAYEWRVKSNCSNGSTSSWSYSQGFTTLSNTCNTPTWPTTSNVTATSAKFSWSSASGAQSYTVQIRLPNGSWSDVGSPVTNTWVTVTGLNPNTTYEWRVRSNCSSWQYSSWTYPVSFTTLGNACNTPTWPTTSNITQTSAKFSWSTASGAQSYTVQIRLPNGTWQDLYGGPFSNNWVTASGLTPSTTYEWRVRSNCYGGQQSSYTYPVSFTTLGASCSMPTWPTTSYITETSAKFSWSSVSGAQSYTVQLRQPNGTWADVGYPVSNAWVTVTGLTPSTTYEWRVRANCDSWQYSNWTYPVTFTTLGTSCTAPTSLYTTYITQTTATFDWSPVSGALSYSIQYRLAGGTWYDLNGGPFTNTWVNVGGFQPSTTYEWRVRSNCYSWQMSSWSYGVSFTTLGNSCSIPTWPSTSNITSSSASFSWSAVSGAQSYTVQTRLPGGTWYDVPGGPFTNNSATVYGLNPNTTYQWRVRANCYNEGYSYWTKAVSFTTSGGASCHAPGSLSTTNITATTATFNWAPVSGAMNYSIQWRNAGGIWYNLSGGPWTSTWLNVGGFQPGNTYEWRVRSNCDYGNWSAWSYSVSFTTLGYYCNTPTWPTTSNITDTSAKLSWTASSGAQNYTVQTRLPNGTWADVPGGPFTTNFYTVFGLNPNTTYEWRVRSNCSGGQQSAWTNPVTFTTTGTSCPTPTGATTSNITDSTAQFTWLPVTGAEGYVVQTRLPNGTWADVQGSPFTDTSVTMTGLITNTTYEWRVRTNCTGGVQSSFTNAIIFTTTGSGSANDSCVNAIVLQVGNTCTNTSGTNVNAAGSIPAPIGGCPTGDYRDVWFKFTMPNVNNPFVTIRTTAGTLTDAVMEVYVGTTCANMTYVTCEDNNTNGNGSTMPVVNVEGGPNNTIWVRVWGLNTTVGTFDICVFNSQSNNLTENFDRNVLPDAGVELETIVSETEVEETLNREIVPLSLSVTPNPATDVLNIVFAQTKETTVSGILIHDVSGKTMVKRDYDAQGAIEFNDQFDVSAYSPGIYFLRVVTTTGIITEKVMVVRN